MTVVYFSIINVLCGAGEDASFAPQANLVMLIPTLGNYIVDSKMNQWRRRPLLCIEAKHGHGSGAPSDEWMLR